MASPHVAGAVALLLEAKPKTKARDVRGILQNSAEPKVWWGNPALGFLDNVHRQGAGMLRIDNAIKATTVITPSKIATGEYWEVMDPWVQPIDVKNNSNKPVTYDISYVNALSTGGVITPSFFTSNAYVEFSESTITVPAWNKYTIEAYIHAATAPVNGIYGGYIVFTPRDGGQVYRIPYAGFVGDYQGIQVLTPPPTVSRGWRSVTMVPSTVPSPAPMTGCTACKERMCRGFWRTLTIRLRSFTSTSIL